MRLSDKAAAISGAHEFPCLLNEIELENLLLGLSNFSSVVRLHHEAKQPLIPNLSS